MVDDSNDNEEDIGPSSSRGKSPRSLESLLKGMPGMASQVLAKATGQSKSLLEMTLKAPEYLEQLGKAGKRLKDLREVSKLTVEDLAAAVNLENPELLRAIEEGRSPITLDILLRLASYYSRNDPMSFVVSFSKEYAPWLWYILRVTGVEKMLITLEREVKFINIYRGRDEARDFSDAEFEKLLHFSQQSFNTAVDFMVDKSIASDDAPKEENAKKSTGED